MRCPSCGDEYEDGVTSCVTCGVPLLPEGAQAAPPPAVADARLGTFHPVAAPLVMGLCARRGVAHETRTTDRGIEILVDRDWRDDLRAELALSWTQLLGGLDEQQREAVLDAGGTSPGWVDPPRGGHIDRTGRLVVTTDDDEDEDEASRILGPTLLTTGVIIAIVGWFLLDAPAVAVAGVALAVVGLFLPR